MSTSRPLLIYIHGFNSSPDSFKAKELLSYLTQYQLQEYYLVPTLGHWPQESIAQLETIIQQYLAQHHSGKIALIGSSLGGYYATYLAEKYELSAVMINPAIRPYELLDDYIGENKNYHTDESYELTKEHMHQLKAIDVLPITRPERYLLLTQTNDETLDFQQGVEKFRQSPSIIQHGGSHGYDGFTAMIPTLLKFLQFRI